MTDTTTDAPATESSTEAEVGPQEVDLQVLTEIYRMAMERLAIVQRRERQLYGASHTTLASIGREAVLVWAPLPDHEYTATPRSPNGQRPNRTSFRFNMPRGPYKIAKKTITDAGASVTQVVEEALNRFALTGR